MAFEKILIKLMRAEMHRYSRLIQDHNQAQQPYPPWKFHSFGNVRRETSSTGLRLRYYRLASSVISSATKLASWSCRNSWIDEPTLPIPPNTDNWLAYRVIQHWADALVTHHRQEMPRDPCCDIDSLGQAHLNADLMKTLKTFLFVSKIQYRDISILQQDDCYNCGFHMLKNLEVATDWLEKDGEDLEKLRSLLSTTNHSRIRDNRIRNDRYENLVKPHVVPSKR